MASIFSASPSFNDTFTSNGTTWQWNGEAWIVVASDGQTFTNVVTSPSSQTITADSPTDTLTIAAGTNISVSGNSSNDTLTISSTINTQDLINTASAAAYTSACGYTNFIVDGLDTLDIEENTNLYFTNQRAIDATSSLITSASANAFSEANEYTNSASSSLVGYVNTASSSLVNYTDSASASLIAYTNSASSSLVAYTNQEVSALQLFSNISTSPSTQLITGDSNSDTLTFIAGENISINADSSTDSITINSTGNYSNVDSISTPDYIQFDTTASVNPVTGLLGWDSVEGTLNLGLSSGKHIHLGEESVFRVRNSTGSTIGKGTALYASGVEPSGRIQVTPYVANGSVREVRFMGLATESISSGVNGFVQHFGYVRDLDTRGTSSTSISVGDETWAAGDLLYVHPTVPGKLTNVKPQHEIVVAIIIIRHQSTGILFVRPTSGGHLEDIHDISLSSLSNEDILIYNSASSIWVNSPKQNIINTASAAAVAYADGLTTTDIAEGTNLYYTSSRGQETASTMFVHGNHTNLSAQYVSGEIRLTSSGGASVIYTANQPDTTGLEVGTIWVDSDAEITNIGTVVNLDSYLTILSASSTYATKTDTTAIYDYVDSKTPMAKFRSGFYYKTPLAPNTTTASRNANQTTFTPIFFPTTTTLDRISILTGSTFSGTGLVRLGIYQNTNGAPNTVILDAGTVAPTAASTAYEITINQTLSAGLYWLAVNSITAASSNFIVGSSSDSVNNINQLLGSMGNTTLSVSSNFGRLGYLQNVNVTSGFATVSSPSAIANNCIFAYVRVA